MVKRFFGAYATRRPPFLIQHHSQPRCVASALYRALFSPCSKDVLSNMRRPPGEQNCLGNLPVITILPLPARVPGIEPTPTAAGASPGKGKCKCKGASQQATTLALPFAISALKWVGAAWRQGPNSTYHRIHTQVASPFVSTEYTVQQVPEMYCAGVAGYFALTPRLISPAQKGFQTSTRTLNAPVLSHLSPFTAQRTTRTTQYLACLPTHIR